uniref:Uncharacterized protein n=1 Tax=Anguilla anguilla TaxID=7936 RepID=A0A0E9QAA0_ANGAN
MQGREQVFAPSLYYCRSVTLNGFHIFRQIAITFSHG